MCLSKLKKGTRPDPAEERIGYKVGRVLYRSRENPTFAFPFYNIKSKGDRSEIEEIPFGRWIESNSAGLINHAYSDGEGFNCWPSYEPAFHIFKEIDGAQALREECGYRGEAYEPIVRVKYRKIVAEGHEDIYEVDVAREMFLMEEVSEGKEATL